MRVGLGFDAHPFAPNRLMVLGGVAIAHPLGLRGHSDGDALLHALTDAVLGAAGEGSIGQQFPDSDPRWKDAASAIFVEQARELAEKRGLLVVNVDATVIAEVPEIAPYVGEIRTQIATLLRITPESVNVRGTSTNGLGFPGRHEGVAAMVVVLLAPRER